MIKLAWLIYGKVTYRFGLWLFDHAYAALELSKNMKDRAKIAQQHGGKRS
jgi:hypothetical protein